MWSPKWLRRIYLTLRLGAVPPPYDGMQSGRSLLFIYDNVRRHAHDRGAALEIGCFKGGSTVWLAKACRRIGISDISAVDIFTGSPSWGQTFDTYEEARSRLDAYGLKNVVLIRADSRTVPWDKPLSVLHIDGDHEYASVRSDLDRFLPFVLPGGIVIMDDYSNRYADVKRATDETLAADPGLEVLGVYDMGTDTASLCFRRKG